MVTYQIFRNSLEFIIKKQSFVFSWQLATVAFITIALKMFLWVYTRRVGEKWDNLLIIANAEDHRNDILVTASTLIGILLGSRGIYWVDGVVGIGISLWIGYTGVRIFISAYNVLMDTNIDEKLTDRLIRDIEAINGVEHVDSINAKPIGSVSSS